MEAGKSAHVATRQKSNSNKRRDARFIARSYNLHSRRAYVIREIIERINVDINIINHVESKI